MSSNQAVELDSSKKEAFTERMTGILNDGFLGLMISVGHRTGLFDTMADLSPSTSAEIASAAGLQERYVRECLGALVTGKIVDYDPKPRTYALPKEHAASLTRRAGADNLAAFVRFMPLVSKVEDRIVDCFRKGGGVPYSEYDGFSEAMHEASSPMFDASLMEEVLPMVPELTASLKKGIDVLEVGCGSGHALMLMAMKFPESRFVGYDLLEDSVAMGKAHAKEAGIENVSFEKKDVTTMTHEGQFHVVTAFDTVHDQARPDVLLSGIARALKQAGTFLMADVKASTRLENNLDHPIAPFLYSISCMHCMTVSLAQNGAGLGAMWGEEKAREMIEEAGMKLVDIKQAPNDPFNNFYIARKP
ncbi:MAG: class I SAM-dependent methyltransferase [Phycisphaerae bacterium]